jgi:hypothetical protein
MLLMYINTHRADATKFSFWSVEFLVKTLIYFIFQNLVPDVGIDFLGTIATTYRFFVDKTVRVQWAAACSFKHDTSGAELVTQPLINKRGKPRPRSRKL